LKLKKLKDKPGIFVKLKGQKEVFDLISAASLS